jgi:hypothetical protein
MLPKAALSFVGRLIGIGAVIASPCIAQAAETSESTSGKATLARPSPSHGHRHKSAEKKAKKRGSRHSEGATEAVTTETRATTHVDDAEVSTERASSKCPPKPSSTPLPTLAAATTKPLVVPVAMKGELLIDTKGENAGPLSARRLIDSKGENAGVVSARRSIEPKPHAVEPRVTPIIRAVSHDEGTLEGLPHRGGEGSRHEKRAKTPCLHAPVSFTRGAEDATFALTRCDGSALPQAVDAMSSLVRSGNAAKTSGPSSELAAKAGKEDEAAGGIKKIDERLVERLQLVIDHFAKPSATPKVFVVSGYRPASKGSFHAMGRAIDFRLDGVENTDLIAFCKTLPDTGCGFYPNSSFIHLDVRDGGAGHVSWIDASGPGEKPEYLAAWPPPPNDDDAVKQLARLDDLQLLPPAGAQAEKQDACGAAEKREKKSEGGKSERSGDQSDPAEATATAASVTKKLEEE